MVLRDFASPPTHSFERRFLRPSDQQTSRTDTDRPLLEQVMTARRGNFERALGALLAFDVLEVEPGGSRRRELRLGRRQELRALEMIDDREKVRGGDDLDLAGPGGFAAASSGADEPALARRCRP